MYSLLLLFYITYAVVGLGTMVGLYRKLPDIYHLIVQQDLETPKELETSVFALFGMIVVIAWPLFVGEMFRHGD